jgi:hypothetical protein
MHRVTETGEVARPRVESCAECVKLWHDSAVLTESYCAALTAFAVTPTNHQAYVHRRRDVASVTTRLHDARMLEDAHQVSRHGS